MQFADRYARVRVRVTLGLAVYCQSIPLCTKPLEAHEQRFYFCNLTFTVISLV
jgi:hypothetical protein